jgi:hypothetical protein
MGYFGRGAGGALAATGTLTIGGIAAQQFGLLAASMILVGGCAIAVRVGFRRGKGVGEQ